MLSSIAGSKTPALGVASSRMVVQQVRNMSRRRIAYPFYQFKRLGRQHPKAHDTNLKYAMRQFLGPKNYKGEYVMNKYFHAPTNHVPNYVKPDLERGNALQNPNTGEALVEKHDGTLGPAPPNKRLENIRAKRQLQPFPENPHCTTNYMVSNELKLQIYNDIQVDGLSTQQVSQKYGLKIPRIEAIVRLVGIEQQWVKHNRISPDLERMASTLYKMFPLFEPEQTRSRENLSEIPIPSKALKSRFVTIAESEPFGPVDAARVLELEPAAQTLEKLSELGEHSSGHHTTKHNKKKVVYGELLEGERALLKFTNDRVGKVGYRYGSGNRDNKTDRKIKFDELGRMVYA